MSTGLALSRLALAVSDGPVTLCFTDIEDSTPLAERWPEDFAEIIAIHRSLIRDCFAARRGIEIRAEGEEIIEAFESASAAVVAAAEAQRALCSHDWPLGRGVRVRMGLHTGKPVWTSEGLVGLDVHRAARVTAAGYGGQVLTSGATFDAAHPDLPDDVELAYLGLHRFKGLTRAERLYQVVARGLPRFFPPPRSLRQSFGNLPLQPTAMLGRESATQRLGALLSRRDLRLVTITGPGGTGKTRLAIEAANQVSLSFKDGVCFVDLSGVALASSVTGHIARALDANASTGGLEPLVQHLSGLEILLVLDNMEHVLDSAGDISELLVRCPGVKVLVTCREPTRIRGEAEFPLPPLELPLPNTSDLAVIGRSPAVQLFIERASAVRPGLQIAGEDLGRVAQICRRLDGLPLAIELVAARARLLSPSAILERLPDLLDLAVNGAPDLPDRHQSLRAAIGWSYDLLPEDQQSVFRRMSVLVGGSSLDAAAAVVDSSTVGTGLLDRVEALVARNLLRVTELDGEPSFWMLETIREYGLERLHASSDEFETHLRHLEYFTNRTVLSASRETQPSHVAAIEAEVDNIRAALAWSLEDPQTALEGLSLATSAGMYWWQRSAEEGSDWLKKLLAVAAAAPTSLKARSLYWITWLAMDLRPPAEVVELAEAGVAEARGGSDKSGNLVMALNILGDSLVNIGELQRATAMSQEAVSRARARGDPRLVGITLWPLGLAAAASGDTNAAREAWTASCEEFDRAGDDLLIATPLEGLARLALIAGDLACADELVTRCLQALTRSGDVPRLAEALAVLADIRMAQGDEADALRCAIQALDVASEYGNGSRIRTALLVAARLCATNGNWLPVATIVSFLEHLTSGPERWLLPRGVLSQLWDIAAARLTAEELSRASADAADLDRGRAVQFALKAITDG